MEAVLMIEIYEKKSLLSIRKIKFSLILFLYEQLPV